MSGDKNPKRSEVLSSIVSRDPNRRRFLKSSGGFATAAAVIPGFSRAAEAAGLKVTPTVTQLRSLVDEYSSPDTVQEAFRKHGSDILTVLSNRNLIESDDASDLEIEKVLTGGAAAEIEEGVMAFSYVRDTEAVVQLQVVKQLSNAKLRIAVEPRSNRSFAVVESQAADSESKFISADNSDVGTEDFCQSHWTGGCYHKPSQNCACTEDDPCGCFEVKVECCQSRDCTILDWRFGNCVTTPSGCCSPTPHCSDHC